MEDALRAFEQVAALAGHSLRPGELEVQFLAAPHQPPTALPSGRMAVYCFGFGDEWLKIGKAGPKSGPRFTSHHYNTSAPSTLAKSLIADSRMGSVADFRPERAGDWIRQRTHRVNLLLPSRRDGTLLALLEAFLHARFKPRYEGH
ncbi:MAG: hypothetical protein DYG94_11525 [Leptolyngbya sp. PLA3]|nr:MAG: hypothetical protein EDM82_11665 [Cyanobacteria bacterium CYA]MCE7969355.1 hypothetical protein [Leptolyngbya sp. PL-A3]